MSTLILWSLSMTGCVAVAIAGAGVMAGDELAEDDGKFDPLEKVRGKDDGRN
ncbi:MAG: hypothetical protein AAF720_03295 [Pseudomonadota bacterium]